MEVYTCISLVETVYALQTTIWFMEKYKWLQNYKINILFGQFNSLFMGIKWRLCSLIAKCTSYKSRCFRYNHSVIGETCKQDNSLSPSTSSLQTDMIWYYSLLELCLLAWVLMTYLWLKWSFLHHQQFSIHSYILYLNLYTKH